MEQSSYQIPGREAQPDGGFPELPAPAIDILRLLYSNTHEYFLLIDTQLRIQLYNHTTWEQVRRHIGIVIQPGTHVFDLSPPTRHQMLRELYAEVLAGKERESWLDVPSQTGGDIISLHNFFLPARDEQGKIVGVLVVAHDISELRRTERALARSEEQWRFALEGSKLGLWDHDLTTGHIYFSPSYYRLYGFAEGSLRPELSEVMDRIHPDDMGGLLRSMEEFVRSHQTYYEYTYRIQDARGSYRWVNARGMVVARDANGLPLRMIGTHDDVTSTIEAERRLHQSEQNYRLLFDSNPLPCLIIDAETREVIRANREAAAFCGTPREELAGMQLEELWRGNLPTEEFRRRIDRSRLAQRLTYNHRDGRAVHIEITSELIRYDDRPARIIIIKDITEQIAAEDALLRSHERFQLATRATSDALYDWDLVTNDLYWGEGISTLFGHAGSEVPIDRWEALVHPDDRPGMLNSLNRLLEDPDSDFWRGEYRFLRSDGSWSDVLDRGYVLRNAEGKATRMIGAMQDISERKQRERQTLTRQKLISQATIETQERERAEIGKELHDNVNQVLTTTKLYLELSMSNKELREELIQKASKNVIYVINEIRQLSRSLMNPSLGDLGLMEAISDLVESVNLTRKLQVQLDVEPGLDELLADNVQLMLYRIVQEALSNALRHSGADRIAIGIRRDGEELHLLISDNGVGFDPAAVKRGAGLRNIENRVYLANGTLRVESAPQRGCSLIIHLPLKTV
ncbi:PAS domain S-box protein [Flaviaesturariibacter flavus]|uniref:histidine kinase n=1 Tax=Flaviaesturariibacter flavus TaxID=2502780 RepID=A0A4R1BA48_9BACT|nr:PAS domain S-box protein [Flaviaesturariibacter flavus]TCJ13809.1 PAS domain S-box protein [Flaviaesturariibacter flavus]